VSSGTPDTIDTRDMVVVHTAFRREFRLAPALVRGVRDEDTRRAAVVADHLDLMTTMLYHHHETEDRLLWPLLLERVPAELAPTVELMERQHERIHAANEAVVQRLPGWRSTALSEVGEPLARALEEVDAALEEHLSAEEAQLLPIAARHLSEAEWLRLGEEGMAGIKGSQLPLAFGMLQYQGDPEVVAGMLSHAPVVARLLMPVMAPRAFARYARKVHGTATP
jgi:Hemerythrin HHE cation binding domain